MVMARKNAAENEAVQNVATDAGNHVSITIRYTFPERSKLSLAVSAATNSHAMAVYHALVKHARGCMVVASPPSFADDAHAKVEIEVYGAQSAQVDFAQNLPSESVRSFIDLVELTTMCVAMGAEAARKVGEGAVNTPRMYEACKPQVALAMLDDDGNLIVVKSPLPYVPRFKKLLIAAGVLTALDLDVQFEFQGKVTASPPIAPDATKVHRYADSTVMEIAQVTGYLRHGRTVEVELKKKNLQLEVPEEFAGIVEQAAKADALVRMALEVYKCNNPCLPDEPHLKIISIDEILGQTKFNLDT